MAYSDATTQLQALTTVHYYELRDAKVEALQAKLAETTLAMERARMSAEDAQGAITSPYPDMSHPGRYRSWQEYAELQRAIFDSICCRRLWPAQEMLAATRLALLEIWRPSRLYRGNSLNAALMRAYRGIAEALSILEGREVENDGDGDDDDGDDGDDGGGGENVVT